MKPRTEYKVKSVMKSHHLLSVRVISIYDFWLVESGSGAPPDDKYGIRHPYHSRRTCTDTMHTANDTQRIDDYHKTMESKYFCTV